MVLLKITSHIIKNLTNIYFNDDIMIGQVPKILNFSQFFGYSIPHVYILTIVGQVYLVIL